MRAASPSTTIELVERTDPCERTLGAHGARPALAACVAVSGCSAWMLLVPDETEFVRSDTLR